MKTKGLVLLCLLVVCSECVHEFLSEKRLPPSNRQWKQELQRLSFYRLALNWHHNPYENMTDHRSYTHSLRHDWSPFLCPQLEQLWTLSLNNIQARMGFETMGCAIPVQCSTNWHNPCYEVWPYWDKTKLFWSGHKLPVPNALLGIIWTPTRDIGNLRLEVLPSLNFWTSALLT